MLCVLWWVVNIHRGCVYTCHTYTCTHMPHIRLYTCLCIQHTTHVSRNTCMRIHAQCCTQNPPCFSHPFIHKDPQSRETHPRTLFPYDNHPSTLLPYNNHPSTLLPQVERTTNHDVKAVEYVLKEAFKSNAQLSEVFMLLCMLLCMLLWFCAICKHLHGCVCVGNTRPPHTHV